jgi:ribosomal protein S18 acetylase RimI-like enzyme
MRILLKKGDDRQMNVSTRMVRRLGPKDASEVTLEKLRLLYAELTPGVEVGLSLQQLRSVLSTPSIFLFVAEETDDNMRMVGMITLFQMVTLAATRGYIEDVAVLSDCRGQHIAWSLMNEVVTMARMLDMEQLSLTSRPAREAANTFYRKYGFVQPEINYYRFKLV